MYAINSQRGAEQNGPIPIPHYVSIYYFRFSLLWCFVVKNTLRSPC
jgi:hypothetical protein